MQKLALALLLLAFLLLGCIQLPGAPAPETTATPASTAAPAESLLALPTEATATPSPTPSVLGAPLKLVYELKQIQQEYPAVQEASPGASPVPRPTPVEKEQKILLNLWLNEERECKGRKAFVGVLGAESVGPATSSFPEEGAWSKLTIYQDNGVLVISKPAAKSDLAFDTAKPTQDKSLLAYFLILNDLFAAAGKNFNTDAVWQGGAPTVLKNVKLGGGSANDYSIVKGDETTGAPVSCTQFTILIKDASGAPEGIQVCVAKPGEKLSLPFTASLSLGKVFSLKLKSIAQEKASVPYYPQCLEAITCPDVRPLAGADYDACAAKNGSIESARDEFDCVTAYKCVTERERAEQDLKNMQPQNCPAPSEQLVNKLIGCRKNSGYSIERSAGGCVTAIVC